MTVFRIITIVLVLTMSLSAFAEKGLDYYTIDDYLRNHKEQKALMETFASAVSGKSEPIKMRQKRPVRIAVIYPGLQKSNYWRDSVTSMTERLDELNIRYELFKYFSKPSGDYRLQAMQLNEAANGSMDYIILSVDNANVRRLVPKVLSKDKPKIMIQNLTTPLKAWDGRQPFMYVGFDHIEGSKIIAEHYAEHFPKGADYVLLFGPKGTVSTLRGEGFESYGLSKGFTPVAKYYTDFDFKKAYEATAQALKKNKDIKFIYACSTDIALGASKAIEEAGLTGKVLINGWGGTLKELDLIRQKKLDFTVMRMNDDNGVAISEAVKLDMMGKASEVPNIFSGEFVTITKKMSWDTISRYIERALRYSGK